jgi:hypothetical protein
VFFGDYTNITSSHGSVRPIWARLQSGQLSIWTAILEEPLIIKSITSEIPKSYSLSQNYPNPFNPSTKLRFDIPESKGSPVQVKLLVYDILGRELAVLANEKLPPGTYEYEWNGSNYSSGVYFYTLTTGDNFFSETKKMILSK